MLLLEIGNSTMKLARVDRAGSIDVRRYDDLEELLGDCDRYCRESGGEIACAPVGEDLSREVLERLRGIAPVWEIGREAFAGMLAGSYDTPETLGLDRILNLAGLKGDGIVISCGTAITIDAMAGGRPFWGAIMPGFRTAAEGLHHRIPVLPLPAIDSYPHLPARTSTGSVVNGVILGTARGAEGVASDLAAIAFGGPAPQILLTGGDAALLHGLWRADPKPTIDDALLFRGMMNGL